MMISVLKRAGSLFWRTATEFIGDSCPQMAAALSYYTVFSLPPLLLLLMMVVGTVVEPDNVRELLSGQVGGLLGQEGADQVESLIRNAERPDLGSAAAILGILAFLFGATGAFAQLQEALNRAWGVAPDPTRGDVRNFLLKRFISFAMILAVGFLLLVSMVVSTLIAAFGDLVAVLLRSGMSETVLHATNLGVSFAAAGLLFAAMFRIIPDAVVRWRDALVGGAFTSLLFTLGKFGIGFWLGRSDPGSAYGAAGSLAVVLLWIYFSSVILLFGAEFTEVWAERRGVPITPEPGAARVIRSQERYTVGRESISAAIVMMLALATASLKPEAAFAQVSVLEEERPRVESIRFEGISALSESDLRMSIVTEERRCKSLVFAPFCWISDSGTFEAKPRLDRAELVRDQLRIRVAYWRGGYRAATASARLEPAGDGVNVVFEIDEGPPTILQRVDVRQVTPVLDERVIEQADLPEAGEPFDLIRLDSAKTRLNAQLWREGYADGAALDSVVLSDDGLSATLGITIDAKARSTVEEVVVTGNEDVSTRTVQRIVGLQPGQIFRRDALVDAQRRLYNSSLFRQAILQLPEPQDSSKRLLVTVQEAPFRAVEVGVGFNTIEFVQVRGGLTRYNLFGGARRLDLNLAVGNLFAPQLYGKSVFGSAVPTGVSDDVPAAYLQPTWQASAEISQPWLLSTRNALSVGVFANRRSIPGIVIDRGYGANATVTRELTRRVSASLSYRYERTSVEAGDLYFCVNFGVCRIPLVEALRGTQSLSPLQFDVLAERTDDPLEPTRGWTARLTAEHASSATFSDFAYDRVTAEATRYRAVGSGILAARVRAGWVRRGSGTADALGVTGLESSLLHPRKRFYSGGSRTVRGYAENQLGPRILTIDPEHLLTPSDPTRGEGCSTASLADGSCDPEIAPSDEFLPRPLGGSSVVGASVEYRLPLSESLVGALFVDAARVGDVNLNEPPGGMSAVTPGFGIRYRSPIGPVRIDLGIRPAIVEDLPVVTQVVDSEGELQLVQLERTKRYSPVETRGGFLRSTLNRLQLHLSIGEAF